jgi:hypothetical protein
MPKDVLDHLVQFLSENRRTLEASIQNAAAGKVYALCSSRAVRTPLPGAWLAGCRSLSALKLLAGCRLRVALASGLLGRPLALASAQALAVSGSASQPSSWTDLRGRAS